jgi:hypothetical protein
MKRTIWFALLAGLFSLTKHTLALIAFTMGFYPERDAAGPFSQKLGTVGQDPMVPACLWAHSCVLWYHRRPRVSEEDF